MSSMLLFSQDLLIFKRLSKHEARGAPPAKGRCYHDLPVNTEMLLCSSKCGDWLTRWAID